MVLMRDDKQQAIKLRMEGMTYSRITAELGISKGTLSLWFKNLKSLQSTKKTNVRKSNENARKHMLAMNVARADKLMRIYGDAKQYALSSFPNNSKHTLFVAALMLYLGEGDKSLKNNNVRITNTDPHVLSLFAHFLEQFCEIPRARMRAWVLLYPDLSIEECLMFWSQKINLPRDNFYKSQVIKGKHKTKKLHYGVGTLIIGDKRLKVQILEWIELLCQKLEAEAGMV